MNDQQGLATNKWFSGTVGRYVKKESLSAAGRRDSWYVLMNRDQGTSGDVVEQLHLHLFFTYEGVMAVSDVVTARLTTEKQAVHKNNSRNNFVEEEPRRYSNNISAASFFFDPNSREFLLPGP